ncbi:flagellar biosynthetic protein FliO [Fulvimarina sp. 2208YS6-2-32]|uniref:Flagellar biosynthetic protein FliO n=1 Tax=Fulvimarina uroteuthidis TaxID=3098149 RepID=A0ABU5I2V5_9HYPH|nr:flagellar biosynthetic protein FliO [Fulvimarina sp. 2208YS6-2-32]MDY8109695.1 flagellar biosynthetic protein FliO [Fulvimarina sp. 2208YS6-2-32]
MPNWFATMVGETFAPILWVLFVATIVCALAVVTLLTIRKASGSPSLMIGAKARAPRLAVVEMVSIGDRRRLVLIRRDDVEHLLLIGGSGDLVIESAIGTPGVRQTDTGPTDRDEIRQASR